MGLSGFPEWLPEQELIQQRVIGLVREKFELHGFAPLQTRSLEAVDELVGEGGETDKEIYGVHRLAAKPGEDKDAKMALHYDLTVPFARYVGEHRNELSFPFRRYQIQPAWRGERPQLARYREFLQADADVIADGKLDLRFDVEMVRLLRATLDVLPVPKVRLLLNNRKLLEGFYRGLGITDITGTLRVVDKLGKIGESGVVDLLVKAGLETSAAERCVAITKIELASEADLAKVTELGVRHEMLDQGITELGTVLREASADARPGSVIGALHIARGLDYYTGTVIEGMFEDHPNLSSVCSGGRYDNLAGPASKPLPGVGVSIGITRLLGYCFHYKWLKQTRRTPALVVVLVHSEEERALSETVARALRARKIPTLVSDTANAYGKQISKANTLGVPYVWFPAKAGGEHEVKDLVAQSQEKADPATWSPMRTELPIEELSGS